LPEPVLLLRADAGGATGSGHVMRLAALGEAWVDRGGTCILASASLPAALAARLSAQAGFTLAPIDAPPWSDADAQAVIALSRDVLSHSAGVRVAAVDSYLVGAGYLAALEAAGLRVLMIDDVARLADYPCALLLNQNLDASEDLYTGKADRARRLLGPDFVILRREFSPLLGRERAIPERARRLLVTFGGVDPQNASAAAVAALADLPDLETDLVLGGANPSADDVARRAGRLAHVKVSRDVRDMASRIAAADIVLSSGGTTIWEAAALGAPLMIVAAAPEEEDAARAFTKVAGIYLGRAGDLEPHALAAAIGSFAANRTARVRASAAARALVDGCGAGRVAAALAEAAAL
jgi:UDP-2,4-diacetamido-2,4,6-trideoxy-beta-L-altropyranose hydrolase